ncbi:MAG: beta-lactamase family protein [Chloroflexi bacterium]|nr:beta-lactamase family protein [Chloroflexota bacterium]
MESPKNIGMSTERLARIDTAVNKHIGPDKFAGAVTLVARRGQIVQQKSYGLMVRETNQPMQSDAIFRIYSMTKPIACVALMMLYEQGHFQLTDPVFKFIPAFSDLKVYVGGAGDDTQLEPLTEPVNIHHLLTHTAGLSYHFLEYGRVESLYRETFTSEGWALPLAEFVDSLCQFPLAYKPGTAWRYSFAHDVVARLVEIMSGQPFDQFLYDNIFQPLGMDDTGFFVPKNKLDRFTAMYGSNSIDESDMTATKWYGSAMMGVNRLLASPLDSLESKPHNILRGGAGLVSTATDYLRFCQMMLNNGQLDGVRLLGRKTIELMTANHLPPNLLPYELGGLYQLGMGYGLGVNTLMDLGQCQSVGSVGSYAWGGAANTTFWIDPQEEMIGILMAQFQPSGYHLLTPDFRVAVYQAIVD